MIEMSNKMSRKDQSGGAMDYADLQMKARSESISGIGSSLSNTVTIRTWLERKLISLGIASLGDIPCGDYHWMKRVDLRSVEYVGYDIFYCSRNANSRPDRKFEYLNAIFESVPHKHDLILCRDFMVHLTA